METAVTSYGLSDANKRAMAAARMEEARWLDKMVRGFIPPFLIKLTYKNERNWFGRFLHVFTDYVIITCLLRIKIKRAQHTTLLGGKGFRPGIDHGYKIGFTTSITKAGKEIARQRFDVQAVFKN